MNVQQSCESGMESCEQFTPGVDVAALVARQVSSARSSHGGESGLLDPGIYDAEQSAKEINEAELDYAKAKSEEDREEKARKHERVLYPAAEKIATIMGYQPKTPGVERRLRGEWNTSDVIAYRPEEYKVLVGAQVELISVEVQWVVSKLAIARANSHQRFTHRTYLMVQQRFSEIDETYLLELAAKGAGLICKTGDGHAVDTVAACNTPLATGLDNFLDNCPGTMQKVAAAS